MSELLWPVFDIIVAVDIPVFVDGVIGMDFTTLPVAPDVATSFWRSGGPIFRERNANNFSGILSLGGINYTIFSIVLYEYYLDLLDMKLCSCYDVYLYSKILSLNC